MSKNPVGRTNPVIDRAMDVLVPLVEAASPQPKSAIGMSTFRAHRLMEAGLVRRLKGETLRTGQPGRPADLYVPTHRAKRAVQARLKRAVVTA